MKSILIALAGTALASGVVASANAQTTTPCPANTQSCTVSVQDAGHNDTASSAENTNTNSSQAGVSSASNASGNTINPNFDNSAQTTQNATNSADNTSNATGNSSTNDNKSQASNGNQSMGQANTGNSSVGNTSASVGQANTGNSTIGNTSTGASNSTVGNLSTGASTSQGGSVGNTQGGSVGNTQATGGTVGNLTTGPSTSSSNTNVGVGATTATSGPVTGTNRIGDIGGNTQAQTNSQSNGSASKSSVGNTASSSGGNTMTGGATTSGSLSDASNSGGNSNVRVDAADRSSNSYRSTAIFIPSVVPVTPPSTVAIGNIIKETSACGPLQRVVRTPVDGTFIGLFSKSRIQQGWTEDLAPYIGIDGREQIYNEVPLRDGTGVRVYGHQTIMFTTVIGLASNRNFALGGGGGSTGGNWGQGGMGSSSSNQRMVTTIQLRSCEIGTFQFPVREVRVEVPVKRIRQ